MTPSKYFNYLQNPFMYEPTYVYNIIYYLNFFWMEKWYIDHTAYYPDSSSLPMQTVWHLLNQSTV